MKLYHVSMGWTETPKLFIPRIPKTRADFEDSVTKRICLSTSIEGCLNAMAEKPYRSNTKLTIYSCNVESFVGYHKLYMSGKVYDACLTQECWYLKPLIMEGKQTILKDFACDCKFVPIEYKKEELLTYIFTFFKEYPAFIPDNILSSLEFYTMYELMYSILPPYFKHSPLDLDDVFENIGLPFLRTMYLLKFS